MFNIYLKASKSEPELLISHTKLALPVVLFPGQLTGKLHCSRHLAKNLVVIPASSPSADPAGSNLENISRI